MTKMPVRIGVNFDGFVTTGEAIALAQRAVDAGAQSLWVAEHLGYREAIATCMAFALKAPGPMLVPTAVSPYLWHPTPTAMAMATLDEVAPGCAAIADRRGQSAVPSGIRSRGRTSRSAPCGSSPRPCASCGPARPSTSTANSSSSPARGLAFKPSAPIPIYIAAMGPDMLRLAGRIGDGVVLSAGLSTESVRAVDRALCRGRRQGRTRSRRIPPRRISVLRRLA